jgi:LysR family transcriptional repressor of citA
MDLDWLNTFVVAAREENFRRTAEILHCTQPTVSGHVDRLEQVLGTPLFHRVGRGVRLNDAGRRFLPYAQAAVNAAETGRDAVRRWAEGYDATVRLMVSPLIAGTFLPRWIHGFTEARPRIAWTVDVVESDRIAELLDEGAGDLGFGLLPSPRSRIAYGELYADPMVLVAPADEYDLDGPPIHPDALFRRYPLLTHSHPLFWDDLVRAVRARYPFVRTVRISQMQVTLRWIEQNLGVSVLPMSLVRPALALGRVITVELGDLVLPVSRAYCLWDPAVWTEPTRAFAAFVRDYMTVRPL